MFAIMYVATGLGITVGFHRLFTHRAFKTTQGRPRHARDPRLGGDRGPDHLLGRRPPQAPRVLRPAGRPAQPARRPRPRAQGRAARPAARARRLAVHPHPARPPRALRAGPDGRPDDPLGQQVRSSCGRSAGWSLAVRARLADRRLAAHRAHRPAVGRRGADARAAPRDLLDQLAVPLLRPPRLRHQGRVAQPAVAARSRRSASRGTTTTTRSRPRPRTGCAAGRSTPRRSSSAALEKAGLAWDVVRVSPEQQAKRAMLMSDATAPLREALEAALPERPFSVELWDGTRAAVHRTAARPSRCARRRRSATSCARRASSASAART